MVVNSNSHFSPLYTVVINVCFWAVSLPFAWVPLSKIGVEYFPTEVDKEEEVKEKGRGEA